MGYGMPIQGPVGDPDERLNDNGKPSETAGRKATGRPPQHRKVGAR